MNQRNCLAPKPAVVAALAMVAVTSAGARGQEPTLSGPSFIPDGRASSLAGSHTLGKAPGAQTMTKSRGSLLVQDGAQPQDAGRGGADTAIDTQPSGIGCARSGPERRREDGCGHFHAKRDVYLLGEAGYKKPLKAPIYTGWWEIQNLSARLIHRPVRCTSRPRMRPR